MNVREIVLAHLKSIGADGLCAYECGCGLDDFMPCDSPNIEKCVPARKQKFDGTCPGCASNDCREDSCYRPMNTTTKEEDTHL